MKYTESQLDAINTIDKNLQIIACAGSGKTQVISQRIVNILKSKPEVKPKNIIAFTYTEKAAAELKIRVLNLCKEQLGEVKGLAEMYIGTIHAWCLQAIQDNIYEFQKFSVLDEIKLKLFIDKYYNKIGIADLGLKRYEDTNRFMTVLSVLREAEIESGKELPSEWLEVQLRYEETLKDHAYFDFTMIMSEAIKSLYEYPHFRQFIDENLKYLIVDEYQDVNPIQEKLIHELSKSGCNICVVGDDDQTIYQWRGGDVNYIQQFRAKYNNVEYIKLEDNFRSTKGVIDCALKCITNNTQRLPKIMNATGHQSFEMGDIIYNQYDNTEDEVQFVIDTIQKLRGTTFQDKVNSTPRGLDYSDCSILLRKWKKAKFFMDALAANNIPFIVGGVNELFETAEIKAAKAIYLYLNKDIEDDTLMLYWESVSDNIDSASLKKAIEYLNTKKPGPKTYYASFNLQDIFWNFLEIANLREETFVDPQNLGKIGNDINEVVFYNLGMFSQIINDFETINYKDKPIYKLNNFLNFLVYSANDYYPEGWLNNAYKTPNAVQIMTIFQSKGLEFPVVFVPGLNKNYLPTSKPTGRYAVTNKLIQSFPVKNVARYIADEEDERRLMYVAITRAQKYLYVTRAPESRLYGKESAFAKEISNSDYLISDKNPDYTSKPKLQPQSKRDVNHILLNFSVLKAYFDCPYRFKLISLYGFVQPISQSSGYGNAIHNILMELHRKHLLGEDVGGINTNDLVMKHLHIPYAPETLFERIKESATKVTTDYLEENVADFDNIIYAEKEIQINLGDGIMVNGRMDLIKKRELDGCEFTTIVDFKSKKDVQSQEITMEQLAMYALGYLELTGTLADMLQIFNLDEDKPSKQTQRLANNKIDEIKTRIVSSANDIRANRLDKTCDANQCKACYHTALCSGCNQ